MNPWRFFTITPWLTVRQAREALAADRPEEARQLLEPLVAEGNRKAIRQLREVAEVYVRRASQHRDAGNLELAWVDLLTAESLNTGIKSAHQCRQALTVQALISCKEALNAGSPAAVVEWAAKLADRSVRHPELSQMSQTAQDWIQAIEQADRGEFQLARDTLQKARQLALPTHLSGLDRFAQELAQRQERFQQAVARLNDAIEAGQWKEAIHWADEATALAPNHREVRRLRSKAWDSLQPVGPTAPYRPDSSVVPIAGLVGGVHAATRVYSPEVAAAMAPTKAGEGTEPEMPSLKPSRGRKELSNYAPGQPLPKRFLLWIDGVGGYLVCLAPRITFGQATADGPVDVPLLAEVSRLHAELLRDPEGYILESSRDVLINGKPSVRSVLRAGDRLTFGPSCQLVFHQPVPISTSARLELASGHRLPRSVDGILLMGESLILSPTPMAHVQMPERLEDSVVIYRGRDSLGIRCSGEFRIDNRPCLDRADLSLPSIVTHDDFTFALEPVASRL